MTTSKKYQPQIPGYYFNPSYSSHLNRTRYHLHDTNDQHICVLDDSLEAKKLVNELNRLYNIIDSMQIDLASRGV